jgi:hypothetical protein
MVTGSTFGRSLDSSAQDSNNNIMHQAFQSEGHLTQEEFVPGEASHSPPDGPRPLSTQFSMRPIDSLRASGDALDKDQRTFRRSLQRERSFSDIGPSTYRDALSACTDAGFGADDVTRTGSSHSSGGVVNQHEYVSRPDTRMWSYQPGKGFHGGDVAYFDIGALHSCSSVRKGSPLATAARRHSACSEIPSNRSAQTTELRSRERSQSWTKQLSTKPESNLPFLRCGSAGSNGSNSCKHQAPTWTNSTTILRRTGSAENSAYSQDVGQEDARPAVRMKNPNTTRGARTQSIFNMDFRLFGDYDLGTPLFVAYAILVLLVIIKMATLPPKSSHVHLE